MSTTQNINEPIASFHNTLSVGALLAELVVAVLILNVVSEIIRFWDSVNFLRGIQHV